MRDGGILTIYALENVAEPGYMPEERLVQKCTAFFSYRTIGVNRLYAAIGANRQIDLLVRCWNTEIDPAWEYVIIDDEQFRIDLAQPTDDATDLTLTRIDNDALFSVAGSEA